MRLPCEKEPESSNAPIVGGDLAKESFKAPLNGGVRSFKMKKRHPRNDQVGKKEEQDGAIAHSL